MRFFGHNFFLINPVPVRGFLRHTGAVSTNASISFCFGAMFYDALVLSLNTALGGFCFGAMFYDAPTRKSNEALVLYKNRTHRAGVYGGMVFGVPIFCVHRCFLL